MTCEKCGQPGHNKRYCKNEEAPPPPKESKLPGRPRKDGQPPHQKQTKGSASVNLNGQPVAEASIEVGSQSMVQASVQVGGEGGFEANVSLNNHASPGVERDNEDNPNLESQRTPITTQESQTTPPRLVMRRETQPKRRWTKCKILQETSPRKGTSAGPKLTTLSQDNVVIGSHSSLTRASAALGVTSATYQRVKAQGMKPSFNFDYMCTYSYHNC